MLTDKQQEDVRKAKRLSNWFEVEITIRLFGLTLLHLKFPPEDRSIVEKVD